MAATDDLLRYAMAVTHAMRVVGGRQDARDHLIDFAQRMYPGYQAAPHHIAISEKLEAAERGELDRLVIMMPPRHGKSLLSSELFPSWYLGRNPDSRIISCSYAADLAYRFSRRARNLLRSPMWPFPKVRTADDSAAVNAWDIAGRRGGLLAAGVGGPITGAGANLLLVDDPVKNAEEAESQTYRDHAWDWYTSTAYTRLEKGGAVILIGTRWHEDDLIGRALNGGDDWEILNLPAIAEEAPDALDRSVGDALWPDKYPVEALERIKRTVGSRVWTSLYQQRPAPAEGTILKRDWWQHWREPKPAMSWILQSWDTAFKTGQHNDYSACLTIGVSGAAFYVLDLWRGRVEFPGLERAVRDQYLKWQPDEIVVEDAASGQSLIQQLKQEIDVPMGWQSRQVLPIVAFKPDRDKVARVNAISPYVEGGRVYLPADAGWEDEFVTEAASFPLGAHDDQVDGFSMGMLRLISRVGTMSDDLRAAFSWRSGS